MLRKTVRHGGQVGRRRFPRRGRSMISQAVLRRAQADSAVDSASRFTSRRAAGEASERGNEASASPPRCVEPPEATFGGDGRLPNRAGGGYAEFQSAQTFGGRVGRLEQSDRQTAEVITVLLADLEQRPLTGLAGL